MTLFLTPAEHSKRVSRSLHEIAGQVIIHLTVELELALAPSVAIQKCLNLFLDDLEKSNSKKTITNQSKEFAIFCLV